MQRFLILLIFCFLITGHVSAQVNALALKHGCTIVNAPSSWGQSSATLINEWSKEAIIDENSSRGWCSSSPSSFPMSFTFELSEEYVLERLGFDNLCQKAYPGICAKEVKVEVSTTDPNSGFKEIGIIKLDEYSKKYYPVKSAKARWIRISILSNYGNVSYTELMDIEAIGKPSGTSSNISLTGQWSSTYGLASFNKNKNNYVYGCYETGTGEIESVTVNGRLINYKWLERSTGLKGWASLTANKEGNYLSGVWGYNEDPSTVGLWQFSKLTSTPKSCPNDESMQNTASGNEPKNYLSPVEESSSNLVKTSSPVEKKGEPQVKQQPVISSSDVDFDPASEGKNFLFIVAINEYKFWNKLSNAKKDAHDVKEVLTSKYRFNKENVYEIFDEEATAANIFGKITELKKHISANDNLLIYYSGHGYYNAEIEEGFWVPVDAKRGVETEYVPNSTLLKYIKSIPAKHIFLVADACFSGSLLSQTSRGYVENVEQYKSRWALTSGRLEFVSDGDAGVNSPFASYFIKFLNENKKSKVAVTELVQYVKVAVSNNSDQTPMGSPMKNVGDEGGEFVFYLK